MKQACRITGQPFEITDEDLKFYEKMGVPPPTLCPEERQRRRLAWRNERNLYHRTCDATGKKIISMYSSDKPFPVYESTYWWSDNWDAKDYGKDFDFQQPFFNQFEGLKRVVPRITLYGKATENSKFTNHTDHIHNCYLTIDTAHSEAVHYSKWVVRCRDCSDGYQLEESELCYEVQYGKHCYHCSHSFLIENCRDSAFLYDCKGCRNCFMCSNLRHKEYHFLNEPLSKSEYEERLKKFTADGQSGLRKANEYFSQFLVEKGIFRDQQLTDCENSSGDFLHQCKNVLRSFDVYASQDCHHCIDCAFLKDSLDAYEAAFDCELQYDTHGCNRGTRTLFSHISYDVDSVCYADSCHNSHDLFGCIGLTNAQYCILNKQYPKEEYFQLREKIIGHMSSSRQTSVTSHQSNTTPLNPPFRTPSNSPLSGGESSGGRKCTPEWGEFFPIELSPFAYNETVAQEYFPLTKEEAIAKGYQWKDEEPGVKYDGPPVAIPDTIAETPDSICNEILTCEMCTKNYRIVKPELAFYRKMNLPVPHSCPNCRHKARMALRNPRKLWKRHCDQCQTDIETTFAPERPEKVYCERCYLKEVQ